MTQNVTDALVLKAADFKENDKIVWLFSPVEGKMSGVLKGVKKASAKLRFAGEPFCFAEFTFVKRGEMATIITAEEKESFYRLRTDAEKFCCGSAVLETVLAFSQEGQPDEKLFELTLATLRRLANGDVPKCDLIEFLLAVLENFGQKPSFFDCAECGAEVNERSAYFHLASGGVLCSSCAPVFARRMDGDALNALRKISSGNRAVSDVALKKALDFLSNVFEQNFKKINSLKQISLF